MRVMTPAVTVHHGTTAVVLDPPYAVDDRNRQVYVDDSTVLAHAVRNWAVENGDNPDFRIALCGYEGEHEMPESWKQLNWKAHGGYGALRKTGFKNLNPWRERIWFSPRCIDPTKESLRPLF